MNQWIYHELVPSSTCTSRGRVSARSEEWKHAMAIFDRMVQGIVPGVITCNTLISACGLEVTTTISAGFSDFYD